MINWGDAIIAMIERERDVAQTVGAGGQAPSSQKKRDEVLYRIVRMGYVHVLAVVLRVWKIDLHERSGNGNLGQNLLRLACEYQQWPVAEFLITEERLPVDLQLSRIDGRSRTVLHYCIEKGCLEMIDVVMRKYSHVDYSKWMEFTWASWHAKRGRGASSLDTMLHLVKHHARHESSQHQEAYKKRTDYHIHAVLSSPLPSNQAFKECIGAYPLSTLSIVDPNGRLPLHMAFSRRASDKHSPIELSLIKWIWSKEPRSASAKDPLTGFYPFEAAASCSSGERLRSDARMHELARTLKLMYPEATPSKDDEEDGISYSLNVDFPTLHLDLIYGLLRCSPSHLRRM